MPLNGIRKIIHEKNYQQRDGKQKKCRNFRPGLHHNKTKKKSIKSLNIRLDQTKEKINKLKHKLFQIIQSEKQKKEKNKTIKKSKGSLRKL